MKKPLTIFIAADHAGYDLKSILKQSLVEQGVTVQDFGTHSAESVDYPDFIHPLAKAFGEAQEQNKNVLGIVICGSGNGVCITANKYAFIRAALVWETELAVLAREHNNANVICLPARYLTTEQAIKCVHAFINTAFAGGRHEKRVAKIAPKLD